MISFKHVLVVGKLLGSVANVTMSFRAESTHLFFPHLKTQVLFQNGSEKKGTALSVAIATQCAIWLATVAKYVKVRYALALDAKVNCKLRTVVIRMSVLCAAAG